METAKTVGEWGLATFGTPTVLAMLDRMQDELAECEYECHNAIIDPNVVGMELADAVIVAYHMGAVLGVDLQQLINQKMAINRQRKWRIRKDGTGQHIDEMEDTHA